MVNHFSSQWAPGWDLLLALGIGVAVIVALAAAAGRWTVSAAWQAATWRIATLGLFVLFFCELTGVGQAVAELCRQRVMRSGGQEAGSRERGAGDGEKGKGVNTSFSKEGITTDGTDSHSLAPNPNVGLAVTSNTNDEAVAAKALADVELAGTQTGQAGKPDVHAAADRSWWLAMAWATGTAALLVWLVGGRVAGWYFRRKCTPCDDQAVVAQVAALKTVFGLRRAVAVLTSPRGAAPVVLGGWRPALVLPPRFTRDFDTQQQKTILAHELAHLVSRDSAWQATALVLCALLWWHPLVWWSRRQLRAANEALADEASLVIPDGPRILAEALVLLGQRLVRREPRFGLSLGGGRFRSGLGRRVQRLLSLPARPWPAPRRARSAFAHFSLPVLLALAAIVGTAGVPSQVPLMQGETTMSVLQNSWRCSLVATALWTMLGTAPAPATAADPPAGTPPAAADRAKVDQQLRELSQKVQQLEKDGKHDEAQKLKQAARELIAKLRGNSAVPPSAVSGPEAEKIRAQLKEIGPKVAQLEKEGKHEEAERLKHEAMALYSKLNPRASAGGVPGGPDREQIRQQMQALHEKMEKAVQAGDRKEIERLRTAAEELQRMVAGREGGPRRPPAGGDADARIQHLRTAAENLMAAGCQPEAQHVMQMIEQMRGARGGEGRPRDVGARSGQDSRRGDEARGRRESAGERSPAAEGRRERTGERAPAAESRRERTAERAPAAPDGRPGSSRTPPAAAPANPREPAKAPAVQELQSQIEQMRRELREVREQLDKAKSGQKR